MFAKLRKTFVGALLIGASSLAVGSAAPAQAAMHHGGGGFHGGGFHGGGFHGGGFHGGGFHGGAFQGGGFHGFHRFAGGFHGFGGFHGVPLVCRRALTWFRGDGSHFGAYGSSRLAAGLRVGGAGRARGSAPSSSTVSSTGAISATTAGSTIAVTSAGRGRCSGLTPMTTFSTPRFRHGTSTIPDYTDFWGYGYDDLFGGVLIPYGYSPPYGAAPRRCSDPASRSARLRSTVTSGELCVSAQPIADAVPVVRLKDELKPDADQSSKLQALIDSEANAAKALERLLRDARQVRPPRPSTARPCRNAAQGYCASGRRHQRAARRLLRLALRRTEGALQ